MTRRVLVTGGVSGLGLALVRACAARGDRVLAADRVEPAEGLLPDGVSHRHLDVTSEQDWTEARAWVEAEWGGLDVLVNNAGIATGGRIDVASLDEWQRVVDVNLLGVVRGCRTFTPSFKAQGSGHLVNTASLAGLVHPPNMGSYNAVKAGVVALSETLLHELGPHGIGVTVVCPSFFRTNLASSLQGEDAQMQAVAARLIEESQTTAEEVADAVLAAVDEGHFLVLPDQAARDAVALKQHDPDGYRAVMAGLAGGLG